MGFSVGFLTDVALQICFYSPLNIGFYKSIMKAPNLTLSCRGRRNKASVQNVNRKPLGKRPPGRGRHRCGNVKMDPKETGWDERLGYVKGFSRRILVLGCRRDEINLDL
jgi:hypothetical protein